VLVRSLAVLSLALVLPLLVTATAGGKSGGSYQTGFDRWRAAENGFAGWTLDGVARSGGALTLDPATATAGTDPAGAFNGRNYYNGGDYLVGTASSPVLSTDFPYREAIASWNATTPPGTWIEARITPRIGGALHGKEFVLGIWAASDSVTFQRHSVAAQGDGTAFVAVDTLVLSKKTASADGYRLSFRLFRDADSTETPTIRNASLAYSTSPQRPGALLGDDPAVTNTTLTVPECSQMVYPDGGEVWCSPTSTSMVLAYWDHYTGPCEPRVRAAVDGVFDWIYDGHGNWPFNTAYAARNGGFEAYVARFTSMRQLEPWIAAGVPVVISYPWKKSDLDGAPIDSSDGHLAVVVGFDSAGDPVVNDPAAATDAEVTRTYDRAQLESLWLENSGGTVYLVYPVGHTVPSL
jgi:hypothetical protein